MGMKLSHMTCGGFPCSSVVKNTSANSGDNRDAGSDPGLGKAQEEMATHFSVLAWEIPWPEEPHRLQSRVSK